MDAKEVGMKVKEFAEALVEKHVSPLALNQEDNQHFVDWLGSALIMQGCMLLLEAGCPPQIVLSRAVGCVKSFEKAQLEEAQKPDASSLIMPGRGN